MNNIPPFHVSFFVWFFFWGGCLVFLVFGFCFSLFAFICFCAFFFFCLCFPFFVFFFLVYVGSFFVSFFLFCLTLFRTMLICDVTSNLKIILKWITLIDFLNFEILVNIHNKQYRNIVESIIISNYNAILSFALVKSKLNIKNISNSSSSWSCRAASTDIPDPLSPLLPIIHRFW